MLDDLDAKDIAQSIRQERDVFDGCFLLLEGKNDDRALKRQINNTSCSLQIVGGKPIALEVLRDLEDEGFVGLLCLVDADYDYQPLKETYNSDHLLSTEVHDLDVAIICSGAFDTYKEERCDGDKVRKIETKSGMDLRDVIFNLARPIGCLRYLASANERTMRLKFSNLKFDSFLDPSSLSLDVTRLFDEVILQSPPQTLSRSEIFSRYNIVLGKAHDLKKLCQGHDLIKILSVALRSAIGNLTNPHTQKPDPRSWHSEIELGLRLAFGREHFEETAIFRQLANWEVENPPYKILRNFAKAAPVM